MDTKNHRQILTVTHFTLIQPAQLPKQKLKHKLIIETVSTNILP